MRVVRQLPGGALSPIGLTWVVRNSHASNPSSCSCHPAPRISVLRGPGYIITASHGTRTSPGLGIHPNNDDETEPGGPAHHRIVGEHLLFLRARDGVLEGIQCYRQPVDVARPDEQGDHGSHTQTVRTLLVVFI